MARRFAVAWNLETTDLISFGIPHETNLVDGHLYHGPMISACRTLAGACMAFALFASSAVWAAPAVEPGLWEVTTKVNLPQLPFGMSIPRGLPLPQSGSRRLCVAQSDIENPQSLVRAQTGCELNEWRPSNGDEGGQVNWRGSCKGQLPSTSAGSMTVADVELVGSATVTTRIEGFLLPIHLNYSGRRLGDCP